MEKEKALEAALVHIEKQFGKGSVMKLGQDTTVQIAAIPTGSLVLDVALGVGGVPRGRVIEIFGPESSGKTTVALHIIAEAQKEVAMLHLSMLSMRLTRSMQQILGLISMNCWFLSLTRASRPWR